MNSSFTARDLDWVSIGKELREASEDAHGENVPDVRIAYSFLLDNPECFSASQWPPEAINECVYEWPADMPQEPNVELIAAYYKAYGVA